MECITDQISNCLNGGMNKTKRIHPYESISVTRFFSFLEVFNTFYISSSKSYILALMLSINLTLQFLLCFPLEQPCNKWYGFLKGRWSLLMDTDCFQTLVIVNNSAINIMVNMLFQIRIGKEDNCIFIK